MKSDLEYSPGIFLLTWLGASEGKGAIDETVVVKISAKDSRTTFEQRVLYSEHPGYSVGGIIGHFGWRYVKAPYQSLLF